jgi:hypothetical protein
MTPEQLVRYVTETSANLDDIDAMKGRPYCLLVQANQLLIEMVKGKTISVLQLAVLSAILNELGDELHLGGDDIFARAASLQESMERLRSGEES